MPFANPDWDGRDHPRHSALLEAIHRLEDALGAPAPGRQQVWAQEVVAQLRAVCEELQTHRGTVEKPGGLYEQLEEAMPRAAMRIQYLRETNAALADQAALIERHVERMAAGETSAFMAVRSQVAALLTELRQQQAREVDLVFEAFQRDTGALD